METTLTINKLNELLNEGHEIEFVYSGKDYLVSCFRVKPFLRKCHVEYWFAPSIKSSLNLQRFKTIEGLLDVEIDGRKLRDIVSEIIISQIS